MRISGERWSNCPRKYKSLVLRRFPELGKSIFSVQRKNKGGEYPYRITPPHAVGFVLRSGVAPQRCPLSYTSAKICNLLEITKTFSQKVAKKGKVSHEIGQKRGEILRFPPIRTYKSCLLRRPKQFRMKTKGYHSPRSQMMLLHQLGFQR